MELILFLEKHHIYTIKGKSFTELLPCDIVTKLKPHIDNVVWMYGSQLNDRSQESWFTTAVLYN